MKSPKQKNYDRPRISVFRSNRYIYAQIIDDEKRVTMASAGEHEIKRSKKQKNPPSSRQGGTTEGHGKRGKNDNALLSKNESARSVGMLLAEKAKKKKIKKVYFDRRRYKYHGRVKALAEGAREGGLEF